MSFLAWFKHRLLRRGQASLIYRRGMRKAHHHDHPGAIEDYTSVIRMPHISTSMKAMALFNRAMVYAACEEGQKAISDLRSLLEMSDTPSEVRTEARRKLARMERRSTSKST